VNECFTYITHHVRKLRGGSQPILVRASDGLLYVAKFANNLQGPNLLFNEVAGTELYRSAGLTVPEWKPLVLTDTFLDKNHDCWMQTADGALRPTPGLCFGSRFLGENGARLLEMPLGESFSRIRNRDSFWLAWLIDICASHVDNRQAVFAQRADGGLQAYFIDHGHFCGGPNGDQQKGIRASCYLDPRIYTEVRSAQIRACLTVIRMLEIDKLLQRIKNAPAEWKSSSALDCLSRCLQILSNSKLTRRIADSMVDAHREPLDYNRRCPALAASGAYAARIVVPKWN
jgi:hypothetical protein